jgi:hypothetical protein
MTTDSGAMASGVLPTYDAEQLSALLQTLPDVDSVELKLTVPRADQRTVVRNLGIDSIDAEIRQVAFIEDAGQQLSAAGLVVRARRTQRKPGDVAVKLRPMLPADVPSDLRNLSGFKVEVDASPVGFTCSCSLTTSSSDRKVKQLMAGSRALSELLDETQLAMLNERFPQDVGLADLRVLGPVHLLKCKWSPDGFSRRMVAELWMLPNGDRILELSTKADPREAFQVAAEAKVFLAGHGVDLGAPQELKTKSALAALAESDTQLTSNDEERVP